MMRILSTVIFILGLCAAASGQYISGDTYTRYELLAPDTHQFKIYYEVTETRAGARFHSLFETHIRGSIGSGTAVGIGSRDNYAVSSDGQRFLINSLTEPTAGSPITVVLNWSADLKK
jgi:hypothetical protein